MERLRQYLLTFGLFDDAAIKEALALFERRSLLKGDLLTMEGQHCKQVAFILSGAFRSYYLTPGGDDMTYCFRFPADFVGAYSSFITGQPSVENIQAMTASEILCIRKEQIERLAAQQHSWATFLRIVAETQYVELEQRVFDLQRLTAKERYAALLTKQPTYLQEIPLQYIASYLGITPRHLSRIRKELFF